MTDDASPRLTLPYLMPSQAHKHVTHNEALSRLDALVQPVLAGISAIDPPANPAVGETWALGDAPTGDWSGQAGRLAVWTGSGWDFVLPGDGWSAVLAGTASILVHSGGVWAPMTPDLADLAGVGIGAEWDVVNRLSVASQATLFSHEGAGHRMTVNKAAPGETASLLLQTDWTGHAEIGLSGDNALSLKVSADGNSWTTALRADPAAGEIVFAPDGTPRVTLDDTVLTLDVPVTGEAVQADPFDTTPGRLLSVGAFGLGASIEGLAANGDYDSDFGMGATKFIGHVSSSLLPNNEPFPANSAAAGFQVWANAASRGAQFVVQVQSPAASGPRVAVRAHDGAWTEWAELYHEGNLLGAVSQSGGAPKGAVIERGANANGAYVRFADGTQMCTRVSDIDVGTTSPQSFNFAAAFVDSDVACSWSQATSAANTALENQNIRYLRAAPTNWALGLAVAGTSSAPGSAAEQLVLTAIGRWF